MQNGSLPPATQELWQDSISETRARLHLLQHAADDLARSRTIDHEPHRTATAAASDLAGALSLFGMHDAAGLARDVEATLNHPGLPQPERLQEQVAVLQTALEPYFAQAD